MTSLMYIYMCVLNQRFDVDVSEEMAKKFDFQMGLGFQQGAQAIVNFVKPKSIASTLKVFPLFCFFALFFFALVWQ
jgi:hypothetical protein